MKVSGVIFDMDGTLLDSMFIWKHLCRDLLRSKGYNPPEDIDSRVKRMELLQAAEYCRTELGVTDTVEEIAQAVLDTVKEYYHEKAQMKKGVKELLHYLHRRGVRMCVATANERYAAEAALKLNGIDGYFEQIFTCTEEKAGKSGPGIYEKACGFIGAEKDAVFVFEDAYHAAKTAKDAGFPVIGVFEETEEHTEKIKQFADWYVNDLSETIAFFENK